MLRRRAGAGVLLVVGVLLAAGCGDSGGAGLTPAEVTRSPSHCPLDLAAAATSAGLEPDGKATGRVLQAAPAIRKIGGVVAECDLRLSGGGELSALVVAADEGSPVPTVLPDLQARAGLATADLARIASSAEATAPGHLVTLPGTAPVALVILPVSGKGEAAARVAGQDGPARGQVEDVARALAAALS